MHYIIQYVKNKKTHMSKKNGRLLAANFHLMG